MTTSLPIAFLAGLVSFLSPCVLPLIPGYISYISGTSLEKIKERKRNLNSAYSLMLVNYITAPKTID